VEILSSLNPNKTRSTPRYMHQ